MPEQDTDELGFKYPDPRADWPEPNPPTEPVRAPELLPHFGTDTLKRLRAQLMGRIPSDPTFQYAVGTVLTELISREVAHPDRQRRDKERDKEREMVALHVRQRAALEGAEKSGASPDMLTALKQRHADEEVALKRKHAAGEFDKRQAANDNAPRPSPQPQPATQPVG